MIYLDSAATSWPKPPEVLRAMSNALEQAGGNPGRSGHRLSIAAARIVYDTREQLAQFFGVADPARVIFTSNATHALNLSIKGILRRGDRVITTSMEHNSVMRPLRALERAGITVTTVPCFANGSLDLARFAEAASAGARLVVATHASNVAGTLLPITQICAIAHNAGALVLVDAAQTAGVEVIDVPSMGIDMLAFTGHKELQGPPGIGGLVISDGMDHALMEPLMRGGTGSRSESEVQPDDLPDKYESGTANLPGIAGLGAGVKWIKGRGLEEVAGHMRSLTKLLMEGLSSIRGVKVFGTLEPERSVAVVSFTVPGKRVSDIGLALDERHDILARVGLHCAPAAHRTIGSFPEGTVRLSPGISTSPRDIETTLEAVSEVARS
jgi:cysteine desulfurase / selenocysteine lyase